MAAARTIDGGGDANEHYQILEMNRWMQTLLRMATDAEIQITPDGNENPFPFQISGEKILLDSETYEKLCLLLRNVALHRVAASPIGQSEYARGKILPLQEQNLSKVERLLRTLEANSEIAEMTRE